MSRSFFFNPYRQNDGKRKKLCDRYTDDHHLMKKAPDIFLSPNVDLKAVCEQMGRSTDWMPDILLCADDYETNFPKKTDMKIAAPGSPPEAAYSDITC